MIAGTVPDSLDSGSLDFGNGGFEARIARNFGPDDFGPDNFGLDNFAYRFVLTHIGFGDIGFDHMWGF